MTSRPTERQLPLVFAPTPEASFDNFFIAPDSPNLPALQAVYAMANGLGEQVIYLWGAPSSGLSHILRASADVAVNAGRAALYLDCANAANCPPPEQLAAMQDGCPYDFLCLDNIDGLRGVEAWERRVFVAFNELRAHAGQVLFASHSSPQSLNLALPDLRSRVFWGPSFQLHCASDDDKRRALQLQAHRLGMRLSDEVASYLIHHGERSLSSLVATLTELDRESLAQQRRLTIPFVKQVLALRHAP